MKHISSPTFFFYLRLFSQNFSLLDEDVLLFNHGMLQPFPSHSSFMHYRRLLYKLECFVRISTSEKNCIIYQEVIVSSKIMKTEGHTINPVYYYYSLTLFSFNGSTMSSKTVYIFNRAQNQVIIGQLTAVPAIKKKILVQRHNFIRCHDNWGINVFACKTLDKEATYPFISNRICRTKEK